MSELIKVSKEFKTISGGLWLGIETTVPEGADIIQAFKEKDELLDKAYMAMNPQIQWSDNPKYNGLHVQYPIEPAPSTDERISGMKELLNLCSTKQLLERQRGQVERLGNEEVTNLFDEKMKTFE